MKKLLVLAMLLSSPAFATNWVVFGAGNYRVFYDSDSVVREGAFVSANVEGRGFPYGRYNFDCTLPDQVMAVASMQDKALGWRTIHPSSFGMDVRNAACSRWWEFWKR